MINLLQNEPMVKFLPHPKPALLKGSLGTGLVPRGLKEPFENMIKIVTFQGIFSFFNYSEDPFL